MDLSTLPYEVEVAQSIGIDVAATVATWNDVKSPRPNAPSPYSF